MKTPSGNPSVELTRENADLVLFAALIVLTAAIGPGFSKLSVGGTTIYVTELMIGSAVAYALLRDRPIAALKRLRALPLLPLGIFWIAGAIATARGFVVQGLDNTLEDVGLFEYSLLLPMIAIVAPSVDRLDLLRRALIAGSIAATAIYLLSWTTGQLPLGPLEIRAEALPFGVSMVILVTHVANELAHGRRPSRPMLAIAAVALLLIPLTDVRSVWIGAAFGIVAVIALAPRQRRTRIVLRTAATGAAALALAVAVQLTTAGEVQIFKEIGGAAEGVSSETTSAPAGPVVLTPESDNTRWRLAFWEEAVDRTLEQPILGAGFGEPFRFIWQGLKYDFRDGDPYSSIDTSGNHNSFIYVLYRMGLPGLLALLAIIGIAIARTVRARSGESVSGATVELSALLAMTFAAIGSSLWTDLLKSPPLTLAFWIPLGLLLVWSGIAPEDDVEPVRRPS